MNDDRLIGDELLHRVQRRRHIEGDRGARGQRGSPFGGGRFSGSRCHQTCNRYRDQAQGKQRQRQTFVAGNVFRRNPRHF